MPFYAILRAFARKSAGVLALVVSVAIFLIFFLFQRYSQFLMKIWFGVTLVLGVIGGKAVEEPFIRLGKLGTLIYFFIIIFFIIF